MDNDDQTTTPEQELQMHVFHAGEKFGILTGLLLGIIAAVAFYAVASMISFGY